MFLPRSVAGPWRRTRRCGSGFPFIVLPKVVTPAGWSAQARDGGLRVDAVVAEDGVQGGLVVPGTFGQALEDQQARHAELAAGELPRPGSAHADRPGPGLAPGQVGAGLHVYAVGGRGEDGARPEGGAAAHPGAADDHAPGPDERL